MIIDNTKLNELTAKAQTNERLRCNLDMRHFEEYFYDDKGKLTDTIDMVPGGAILNIEKGQWHSLKCLESGTILFEAKDGPYHPLDEDEIWKG